MLYVIHGFCFSYSINIKWRVFKLFKSYPHKRNSVHDPERMETNKYICLYIIDEKSYSYETYKQLLCVIFSISM